MKGGQHNFSTAEISFINFSRQINKVDKQTRYFYSELNLRNHRLYLYSLLKYNFITFKFSGAPLMNVIHNIIKIVGNERHCKIVTALY